MIISPQGRSGFLWGFAACAFGLGFALYLQYVENLEPCPLCILQRVAMLFAGIGFLIAGLWNPQGFKRLIAAIPPILGSAIGFGIAARHVWLQGLPPDQVPACGPPLDYLLNIMPLTDAIAFLLRGEGSCAVIDASFLGMTIPGWVMLTFAGFTVWAIICAIATDE